MKYFFTKRNETPCDPEKVQRLENEYALSSILAQMLHMRGFFEDAGQFLKPDIRNMHDPYLFSDMKKAVGIIKSHIRNGDRIAIFGDYDSDGVCASAILYLTLRKLNAKVSVFLPNRSDGYGLSGEAVSKIAASGAALMVTVDCGISSAAEVRFAKAKGISVIITDHHECPEELPEADVLLDPKRKGETYPFRELSGGGVAFKMATALIGRDAFEFIDLAAVSTIGDVVPLLGENRIIAAKGLYKLNAAPLPGLEVLINEADLKKRPMESESVAFGLVPRINASGRIGDPRLAFELLCGEKTGPELQMLARDLCVMNAKRQTLQEKIVQSSLQMAEEYAEDRVLVLQDDSWDTGIVGLAASAVTTAFCKPAVLLGERNGVCAGSARSVPGVNIYEALKHTGEWMETFGGHEAAAGMTLKKENIPFLRKALNLYMFEHYSKEYFVPKAIYDIEMDLSEVTGSLVEEIKLLMPFGCGNDPVKIFLRGIEVLDKRPIGNGKHSRLRIAQGKSVMDAVAFKTVFRDIPVRIDVLATPQRNDYNGNIEVILDVISF